MSENSEQTWVSVKEVCSQYGLQYNSALNKISFGKFPVPTFKVGRIHAIDKEVHRAYFDSKRNEGLSALKNN